MPGKRFTNEHIAFALRQGENGGTMDEVYRMMGVSGSRSDLSGRGCVAGIAVIPRKGLKLDLDVPCAP